MKNDDTFITIKRQLKADNGLKKFLEDNMWYRRKIYNLFVEEFRKWDELPKDETNKGFNILGTAKSIYNNVEKVDPKYSYYCSGIREGCVAHIRTAIKLVFGNRKGKYSYGKKKSTLHFKSYDRLHGSFKVYNKKAISTTGEHTSNRCMIIDDNHVYFSFNKNKKEILELKEPLHIELKPSSNGRCVSNKFLYSDRRYKFKNSDILEVAFVKELDKYYICLCVRVKNVGTIPINRKLSAGIDLGLRNPVAVRDGNKKKNYHTYGMSQKEFNRLHYLERRAKRLQKIMDRKMETNRKRLKDGELKSIYTKNYERVRKKFRITYLKMFNLRLNWRRKLAHKIVNSYDLIVVDEFLNPSMHNQADTTQLNRFDLRIGMYYFIEELRYMAMKYWCVKVDAPDDTTRMCSSCGHLNEHLKLGKKYLVCTNCGLKIDRDENAALNCYKYSKRLVC